MRTATIIFVLCAALVACSQTTRTFTGPDGTFRFRYPDTLIDCMPQAPVETSTRSPLFASTPMPDSCLAQGEVCDGPGSGGKTQACFAYQKGKFTSESRFVAATFYVAEIESDKTETACLNGSHDWLVIKQGTATTINHIAFKKFEIGDNWTSGGQDGPAYRTFNNAKCYELGIQTVFSRAVYDDGPAKDLTKKKWSEIERTLNAPLDSFEFLK